jgi:hypothetical protein
MSSRRGPIDIVSASGTVDHRLEFRLGEGFYIGHNA